MLLVAPFFLLLTGGNSSDASSSHFPSYKVKVKGHEGAHSGKCGYQDVLNYLNLTRNNDLFSMSRPVKHYDSVTVVYLIMAISAILDVRETDQTFISYICIHTSWYNDYISWDPEQFCGLKHVKVPADVLWKPDIIIEEMIEKDKAPPSLYLKINSDGEVAYRNDRVVISTCKMHVDKFPFDIQKCNLSFRSLTHSDEEINFLVHKDDKLLTNWSRMAMQTQYEWLFLKLTIANKTDNYSIGSDQTTIIYTIHMKRRSILYIANFLLPVLFLLCLDLSSFLIPDSGGEKISFKVTVMLAVTVMQLILNDILPCSSDRVPLIAVFCIGVFSLMMLSLLETILMSYLIEKDVTSRDNGMKRGQDLKDRHSKTHSPLLEMKRHTNRESTSDVPDQISSGAKQVSSSQLTEVSLALEKVSDELEQIEKTMTALKGVKEWENPGYWTRLAQKINRMFITFYVVSVTVFLIIIFSVWCISEEEQ